MESIGRLTACGAPVDLALRQEIGDSDGLSRRGERRDRGVGAQRFDRRVAPVPACRARARRLTMDLQHAVVEVERAANDADIRLGLGPVNEDDRTLTPNEPALP